MTKQAESPFALSMPLFVLGIVVFFANIYSDLNFNIPLGEPVLLGLTFFAALSGLSMRRVGSLPGLWPVAVFILWITLSNFSNGVSFSGQFRNTLAGTTLFIPIFFFMLANDKKGLMSYILGGLVGFGLYFFGYAALTYINGDPIRNLRSQQPTPVVPLALYVLLRPYISKKLGYALLTIGIGSFLISISMEARGAMLSILLAAGFYALIKLIPSPRITVPAAIVTMLMAHFLASVWHPNSYDLIVATGNDTQSNLERAAAIDYCKIMLNQSPWFGISPGYFALDFPDYFESVALYRGDTDRVQSPHNAFLEYSVFFGYMAGLMVLAAIGRFFYTALRHRIASPLFVALTAAGVVRLGAFYGFSGIWRIEWFSLLFALYFYAQLTGSRQPGAKAA